MLTEKDAIRAIEVAYEGAKVEAMVVYKGMFLARVRHTDPDEADYDPFYAVHPETGAVAEFSVLTDGNIGEIAKLFAAV